MKKVVLAYSGGLDTSYCLKYLKNEIYTQIERINNDENKELLEVYHLFYDGYEYNH